MKEVLASRIPLGASLSVHRMMTSEMLEWQLNCHPNIPLPTVKIPRIRMVSWMIGLMLLAVHPDVLSAQSFPADAPSPISSQSSEKENAATPSSLLLPPKATDKDKKPSGLQSPLAILGSLALVLGIFFLIVWALRRTSPNAMGTMPAEAFEVLGRAPLGFRQQAIMLRCGNKLLLITSGMAGTEPLTEITDPAEVERLTELCRRVRPAGATALFRNVFRRKETRHE
jgi:flagellar biogenesis protein FliO